MNPLQLLMAMLAGLGLGQMPKIMQGMVKATTGTDTSGAGGMLPEPMGSPPPMLPGMTPPMPGAGATSATNLPPGLPEFLRFMLLRQAQGQRQPTAAPATMPTTMPLVAPAAQAY